jgi:hypothetical protein
MTPSMAFPNMDFNLRRQPDPWQDRLAQIKGKRPKANPAANAAGSTKAHKQPGS